MDWETEMLISGKMYKRLYERHLEELKQKYDLKRIDLDILYFLCRFRDKNTPPEITDLNQYTKGHVSQSLDRLTRKGLVETSPDKTDRRCLRIFPRESAEAVYEELQLVREKMFEIMFRGIVPEEMKEFNHIAKRIYNNMYDEF
ncbi:MAG: MarR family winged helix-turn-helix transcriptional regulator [Blautia sp.]